MVRLAVASHHPCTGAQRRNSPRDGLHGLPRRGACPTLALGAQGPRGTPGEAAELGTLTQHAASRQAVEAAGSVDAQNAPTDPWKPQNGFHSSHKPSSSYSLKEQMVQGTPARAALLLPQILPVFATPPRKI